MSTPQTDTTTDEVSLAGGVVGVARPRGWQVIEPPGGVVFAAVDSEAVGFRPNVTLTVDDDTAASLDQRVAALEDALAQLVVIACEQRGAVQAVTAAHEHGGVGVVSTQRYVPVDGGGVAVVSYTCAVEQYPAWFAAFARMADAVRVFAPEQAAEEPGEA